MDRNRLASFVLAFLGLGAGFLAPVRASAAGGGTTSPRTAVRQEAAKHAFVASMRRTLDGRMAKLEQFAQKAVKAHKRGGASQERAMSPAQAKAWLEAHAVDLERFRSVIAKIQNAKSDGPAPDVVAKVFAAHFGDVEEAANAAIELEMIARDQRDEAVSALRQGFGDEQRVKAAKQARIHPEVLQAAIKRLDVSKAAARTAKLADALAQPMPKVRAAVEKLGYIAPEKLPARVAEGLALAKSRLAESTTGDTQDARRMLNLRARAVLAPAAAERKEERDQRAAKQDEKVRWMVHAMKDLEQDYLAHAVMLTADDHGAGAAAALVKRALGQAIAENAMSERRPLFRAVREQSMREMAAEMLKDMETRALYEAPRIHL